MTNLENNKIRKSRDTVSLIFNVYFFSLLLNCARIYKYTLIFRSKTAAALYVNPQNTGKTMVIKVYMNLSSFCEGTGCMFTVLYCMYRYMVYVISGKGLTSASPAAPQHTACGAGAVLGCFPVTSSYPPVPAFFLLGWLLVATVLGTV